MKNINKYRLVILVSAIFALSFTSIIAFTVTASVDPTRPPPDLVSRWLGENNASNTQLNVNASLSTECTLSFVTSPHMLVGDGPVSVTKGDFNGDGKIDIATANYGSNNISILVGTGDGTFQLTATYNVQVNPQSLTVGDFNNDNKLDLAVANSNSNTVSILLNDSFCLPTTAGTNLVLFGVPELSNTPQSIGGGIYRFQVPPTGNPVLDATITDSSFYNSYGLALSSAGELFVTNRGQNFGQGGSVSRFLNPTGTPISNGVINSADFYSPHGAAFRGNELFVAEGFSNSVLRFVIDSTGNSSPNGAITAGLANNRPRGVAVSPWGEIFVSQCCGANTISRYLIDGDGNAVQNGIITGGGLSNPHDMEFSPQGYLFVANADGNSVSRFTFDTQKNASSAGQINSATFNGPIGLAFSPSGELFVCNHANTTVSRFTFNGPTPVLNGTFSALISLRDIEFAPLDSTAPTTTAAPNPNTNAAGWNNSNVNVTLSATDNTGGTGVREIVYSAAGAETIQSTTVNGTSADFAITAEGETTVTYFAMDNVGNVEEAKTLIVKIDKTAPTISCGTADGVWHSEDISIACTATENVSLLANVADANFSLATNVADGSETDNASTNSIVVCDIAGNCAAANSISGNKVDKKAPVITVIAPTAETYLLNQAVAVNYTCTDGGSGVSNCSGTTSNGGQLDTGGIGGKIFTVNATDNVGNSATPTIVNYTVAFGVVALFDQTKAHKSGSAVPIKIRLVDANGVNVSVEGTVVHAVSVIQISSQASTTLDDAGNSNSDYDFRYDQSLEGYIFNLKTTGYGTGTYQLNFTAGNGLTVYSVQFQVRQ